MPQTAIIGKTERQALPLPSLAMIDALLKKAVVPEAVPVKEASRSHRHNAKADIPEADEAMPLLCGKLFCVSILRWY
jgi:hypothetical protein